MARISKPRKSITTMWTDPHTGVQYTVQAQHALSVAEMREMCVWTARLQDDLRSGAKQMITTPHDASAETPAYIMQGKVDAIMDNRSNLKGRAIGQYLDTVARKMMQQPVQQQQSQARADRYAEFEWTPQATSLLADRFERMPHAGDRVMISDAPYMVLEVWSAFGQTRMRAQCVIGMESVRTFERIARNQWRAFQDPSAPVFSL
jgi:hypothetical protein